MSTIVTANWSSGSYNKKEPSCVGIAGQNAGSSYYHCSGTLSVRQNDDGSIDANMVSFTCDQDDIMNASGGGWGGNEWTFHGLYLSTTSFTLYDGPGGPSGYGSGSMVWSSGHIAHEGYGAGGDPHSHYSYLENSYSTGWMRIADSVDSISHSDDFNTIYLYLGGMIDYNGTPTNTISITSLEISFTSESDPTFSALFDYYPWERRISNTWYSLNREGGKSTTAGLFRKISGEWSPITNRQSSNTDNDHGFRYNSGWQKSPKSGQGAI